MQKFQPASNAQQDLSPTELVEALLIEAGAAEHVPTDEGRILKFLKLEQLSFDFMHELDFLPETHKESLDLRAALSLNDRLVVTQSGLNEKRKRFGIFHEVAHFILPDHREKLFLDNDATLGWWTKARIEREANEIAAELLFQGSRFTEEALSASTSARTPIRIAPKYGASYESALRRYTERHVLPCALVVYTRLQSAPAAELEPEDVEYNIHYTITSPQFRKEYFSALEVKGGTIKAAELCKKTEWRGVDDIFRHELVVEGCGHFETEMFSNGYKLFQFVLPPKGAVRT